jgi:hypothetical protein
MTEQTAAVRIPFAIRKRGGRKLVLTPDGTTTAPATRVRVDSALHKALARGFRWQKILRKDDYQTLKEIASAENINLSYVSRVLHMTLLAPEIVETGLGGAAAGGTDDGEGNAAVSMAVAAPGILMMSRTVPNFSDP